MRLLSWTLSQPHDFFAGFFVKPFHHVNFSEEDAAQHFKIFLRRLARFVAPPVQVLLTPEKIVQKCHQKAPESHLNPRTKKLRAGHRLKRRRAPVGRRPPRPNVEEDPAAGVLQTTLGRGRPARRCVVQHWEFGCAF